MPAKAKAKGPQIAKLTPAQISLDGWAPDGSPLWTHTPPPLAMVQAGQIAWRAIWCAGFDLDADGKKHYHHLDCIPCHCSPGPQQRSKWCAAREIAHIGTRGSAKSESTFDFLTSGNLVLDFDTFLPGYDQANPRPADITYLNCPDYSFLVLRKNSKDLLSYFKRASRYFAFWGGEMTKEPMGVTFPSGAYGIFDHLADEDSYEKYIGAEFTRIVLEEANQIPEEKRYLKIKASCRTSNPLMRPQLMLTYNPGGPGSRWLKSRFMMPGGRKLPFGQTYRDPYSQQTRIVIFSSVEDNPYALASGYDKELDSLRSEDPALYKQWRLGDFEVQQGQFFEMFREKPQPGEPENACHVVKPHALPAEWPTAIGCDAGYSHASAVIWGKWSPKKQLHVYREFVQARLGYRDLGVEIARRSLDDLAASPNPRFNLYLSHDAFHRESEGPTEAELIRGGIESILGKDSVFIFDRSEEERLLEKETSWEAVKRRADSRRSKTHITVINAGMKRRGNFNLIRDQLRWWPLASEAMVFNEAIYRNLIETEGEFAGQAYLRTCKRTAPEVLPILRIHYDGDALDPRDRGCEKLVVGIQAAVEKESDHEELLKMDGDDSIDSLGYLCGNFSFQTPWYSEDEKLRQKILAIREKLPNIDTNSLIRNAERLEAIQKRSSHTNGFNISRVTAPLRRRMAGARR